MPLCFSRKDSPYISNAPCLLEPSIDRIWPKKKYSFKCLTFSSFLSNIWHIWSLWMIISTIFLGIWGYSEISIYGNIFCLQNTSAEGLKLFLCLVRGCPFIKIWFNGSIRTSFTESYLDGLSHVWGSPTKIDKNSWSDWAMWETLFDFVGFCKASYICVWLGLNKTSQWE